MTVHDVASMTRAEVETLLEARERGERVCLHLHVRRSDGAVLVADGHVERLRLATSPPSRIVAAAMATATAMTACSMKAPPPEAPSATIAIGEATAPPIETRPPEPPPIEAPPPPIEMPEPARPAKVDHSKKVAAPPPKKTPAKKHYDVLDGDAW